MSSDQTVVFVCEHGAAKSVLAASYFNHLVKERRLLFRAIARGTAPDPQVPARVQEALAFEGLSHWPSTPAAIEPGELERAHTVVTFDQPEVGLGISGPVRLIEWNGVPPVSTDLDHAREEIIERVSVLLDDLAAVPGKGGP